MIARWLLVLVACAACKKEAPAPAPSERPVVPIPAAEITRGQDACKAYVEKVCACEVPAAKSACSLARALPEAIRVGVEVSASPDSSRLDTLQAQDSVRKAVKECIEETAKLPTLGC